MVIDPTEAEPNVVTRDGSPIILFAYMSKQQRPYLGMFYNKDSWIACSWTKDGSYLGKGSTCGMDMVIVKALIKEKL